MGMPVIQKKMETKKAVTRTVEWINEAESQVLKIEGSYADGGRAAQLLWMKNALLTAPNEEVQCDLLDHWTGTGALPRDLLVELKE